MNKIFRLAASAALALCACVAGPAGATDWPKKPITLIVPFPPGGFTDNVTRAVSIELGKELGQSIIVDNRPGAGGRIGTNAILRAPKDGYTIGLGVPATLSLLPVIDPAFAKLSTQYAPITMGVQGYLAIAINPEKTKARTFKEFVEYAKSNPGKVSYGTPGAGTSFNLWGEVIADAAGFTPLHVPYKGEAPAITDLLGGQIDFMLVTGASKSHVESGRLKVLATTGRARWSAFPDAPTLKEAGLGKELVASGWMAFIAPAGTPQPILDRLNAAFVKALRQPSVEKVLSNQGYSVVASPPQEVSKVVQEEVKSFSQIIKSGKVKLE
ncbi:tripartite tricarboxylate transporter substrate binding protein [Diaphorobacter sp.]|uniref:Bug family tripartite tricarboxylate transporter substrate binding protein n=1 Tax=Diaphorobacter sp. TaxID=1934310 RepID=UPI0028A8248D|nr:tripartite tricarboxylate transporter substrate binding protein [Diaphorobacter sp.]